MARINLSVDEKVFEEFSYQAQRQNKTLFAFANESLSVISKVSSEGGSPQQLEELWKVSTVCRQVDVMTLPVDFLDILVEKLYEYDKEWTLDAFSQLGSSLVGLFKMVVGNVEELDSLAKDFALILPIKRFKITRINDSSIQIDVIGAGRKIYSTECSFEFLKSLLSGYGWDITEKEIGVGTIRAVATRRNYP
ncbi:MAG: hypothetical protein QXX17_02140 [Conexivisphaerales archaeon]